MWKNTEKKPIGLFLLLTFFIAWACEAILIVLERLNFLSGTIGFIFIFAVIGFGAGFAPAYATYIILRKYKKIENIKSFAAFLFKGSFTLKAIVITLLFFAGQFVLTAVTNSYTGQAGYMFILYIPLMVIGGGMEEIGWRGFFQPALEEKFPFPLAAFIVGLAWAVWHLPLWFIEGASQSSTNFISFLCYCIVFSFVLGMLYKLTKNTLMCILLHAWGNVLGTMFIGDAVYNYPNSYLLIIYAAEIVVSIVVVMIVDKKRNAKSDLLTTENQ